MAPKDLCRLTEDEARAYLESIRWLEGPFCHHCGSTNVVPIGGKTARPGLKRCRDCRRQLTVTTGTIFEGSHIKLRDWVYAFARMCSSKKGISAKQLQRELKVAYKSAWHMCHRIRHAMRSEPLASMLSGVVEVDEAWCGGKPRESPSHEARRLARMAGKPLPQTKKTPIVALVERNGQARTRVVCDVTASNLKGAIRENVDRSSTIMTDENRAYSGIGREFAGGHRTVTHAKGEYARRSDGASTNTAEAHFALIKRGLYGTFHRVSKKHLQRYCDEFDFRWNTRKVSDVERTRAAIQAADGKRLMYRQPIPSE